MIKDRSLHTDMLTEQIWGVEIMYQCFSLMDIFIIFPNASALNIGYYIIIKTKMCEGSIWVKRPNNS